eukprot:4158510-Amphidinium_carterae.1
MLTSLGFAGSLAAPHKTSSHKGHHNEYPTFVHVDAPQTHTEDLSHVSTWKVRYGSTRSQTVETQHKKTLSVRFNALRTSSSPTPMDETSVFMEGMTSTATPLIAAGSSLALPHTEMP